MFRQWFTEIWEKILAPELPLPEIPEIVRYKTLPIKYKVYVAGNHDSSIEKGLVKIKDFEECDVVYLEDDYVHLEGFKIHGSPITPNFGNWSFMKSSFL